MEYTLNSLELPSGIVPNDTDLQKYLTASYFGISIKDIEIIPGFYNDQVVDYSIIEERRNQRRIDMGTNLFSNKVKKLKTRQRKRL